MYSVLINRELSGSRIQAWPGEKLKALGAELCEFKKYYWNIFFSVHIKSKDNEALLLDPFCKKLVGLRTYPFCMHWFMNS